MKKKKILLLDPFLKNTTLLESAFKSWLTYYESRNDREISDWATEKPLHALQTDSNNCGIFVINYISRFILDDVLAFDTSPISLAIDRSNVAKAIENHKV